MAKATSKKEAASKYHLVNNFNEITHHLVDIAQKYNHKLAVPTMAATKETIGLIRKDPKRAIEKISDDGREWVAEIQAELCQRINRSVDDGREFARDLASDPQQIIGRYVDNGKAWVRDVFDSTVEIVEDITEDGKMLVDEIRSDPLAVANDIVQAGRKYIDRFPGMRLFEKQVAEKKKMISETLNLPTKDDLRKLGEAIDSLNKKIDHLSNRMHG